MVGSSAVCWADAGQLESAWIGALRSNHSCAARSQRGPHQPATLRVRRIARDRPRSAELEEAQVRLLPKQSLLEISSLPEADHPAALQAAVVALSHPDGDSVVPRRRLRPHAAYSVRQHLDGSTSHRIHPERLSPDQRAQAIHDLSALLAHLRQGDGGCAT